MALLAESRNSVHDLVRDELHGLMGNSRLSSDDKQRLQQHFDSIRDLEVNMGGMGGELVERCSWDGVEIGQLEALETFVYDRHGQIEIDIVRMQTLAAGLDHFKARGLEDKSFVLWTNGFTDCPAHSFRSVPHIVWGDGGGHLRQGAYVDAGGVTNNQLLNALITAAIQDTGEVMETFGEGTPGQLGVALA
jgi:hypothetical protein